MTEYNNINLLQMLIQRGIEHATPPDQVKKEFKNMINSDIPVEVYRWFDYLKQVFEG
jgi:hypothetical protein